MAKTSRGLGINVCDSRTDNSTAFMLSAFMLLAFFSFVWLRRLLRTSDKANKVCVCVCVCVHVCVCVGARAACVHPRVYIFSVQNWWGESMLVGEECQSLWCLCVLSLCFGYQVGRPQEYTLPILVLDCSCLVVQTVKNVLCFTLRYGQGMKKERRQKNNVCKCVFMCKKSQASIISPNFHYGQNRT